MSEEPNDDVHDETSSVDEETPESGSEETATEAPEQPEEAPASPLERRLASILQEEDLGDAREQMQAFLERSGASSEDLLAALAILAGPAVEELTPHARRAHQRSDRETGGRGAREDDGPEEGYARFYIAVGHFHGVRPGNIVGAITGESDLTSDDIGRIQIHDSFSTVDLNKDRAEPNLGALSRTVVRGQELRIRPWVDDGSEPPRSRGGYRRGGGGRGRGGPRRGGYGRGGGGRRGGYRREYDDRSDDRGRGGYGGGGGGGGRGGYGGGGGGYASGGYGGGYH